MTGSGGAGGAVPAPAALAADIAEDAEDPSLSRILTVPNLITTVRLACVPLFVWLLFGAHRQTAAAVLLAVLGATDWIDGFAARRWHQVSTLGKVLDPVADRVLVLTGVMSVIVVGAVPVWFGAATVAREAAVSGAVVLLAALGAERIDVLWVGKAGTFGLMFAYPTFLLAHGTASWQHPFEVIAWLGAVPGLLLAWVAAAAYVPRGRKALTHGRQGRTTPLPVPTGGTGDGAVDPGGPEKGGVSSP